jgi:hypothetical protein
MLVFGPLSSVFDLVTFGLLLWVFHSNAVQFHTGWFVESLSTQILVIFIIRTAQSLQGPAACGPCGEFSFRLHHSGDTSILADRAVVWLRPATRRSYGCARPGYDRLSNLGLRRKALVLCALSAELMVRATNP